MLRKERKAEQRGRLMYVISDHIEKEKSKRRMTGPEADEWYTDYTTVHPTFKYAVDEPSKVKSQTKLKEKLLAKHGPSWREKFSFFKKKEAPAASPFAVMHAHVL